MTLNAIQALSLRKPDITRNNKDAMSQHHMQSEVGSRFGKKSNIKEMLIRNFFRKYPISISTSDMD